jgi:hypothetical protein
LRMELLVPAVCSWPSLSQPPTHSPKRDRADVSVGDTLPVATKVNWGDSSTVPPVCVKLCGQGTTVGLADTDIVKVTPTETTTASATRRRCMSRCTLVVRMNEVGMCCTRRCSAVQHATLKLQPGLDVILHAPYHHMQFGHDTSGCMLFGLGCAFVGPCRSHPPNPSPIDALPQWALTTLGCLRARTSVCRRAAGHVACFHRRE